MMLVVHSRSSLEPASMHAGRAPLELWWMAAEQATQLPRAEAERRFAAVLAASGDAIWRLCRFREKDADARRDLYQEIALSVWQALPGFRAEASERTWALRIAHNIAATHVGRAVRRRHVSLDGMDEQTLDCVTASGTASAASDPVRRLELLTRLGALDVPSQQLVLLHLEGLTTREIAEVTGLTQTNVTTRLNRLRMRWSAAAGSEPAAPDPASEGAEGARA